MAAIGWTAFGTLCTKVLAEASTPSDVVNYTMMAIGVCASCAALVTIANRFYEAKVNAIFLQSEVAAVKSMAEEMRFSENRVRLLALAQRMEKMTRPDGR
jgi:hypothetical protein